MPMPRTTPTSRVPRNTLIVLSVVLFHVTALWALQSGLLRRAVEEIIPAEVLSEFMDAPAPKVAPRITPVTPPTPVPAVQATVAPRATAATLNEPAPLANAPTIAAAAPPAATNLHPVTGATTAPAAIPSAPPRVELPSSDAQYLQNPKPPYPAISKRLGEQCKVVLRVLIGTDGTAQRAEIQQSSGFERLDQAALATVLRWHYVPGKRGGVAEAMWFNVPINFVLE
jgi:periplasmic protein TonB